VIPAGLALAALLAAPPATNLVPRAEFNRIAAELDLPLFWSADRNGDGAIDPGEVAVLWGVDPSAPRQAWIAGGRFTGRFRRAYDRVARTFRDGARDPQGLDAAERARRAAVRRELSQGRPTLVATDLSAATAPEKALARHVLAAASVIERLYARQMGATGWLAKVPANDPASRMLFFRNQGPRCVAPLTQDDPACAAVPGLPRGKLSGLYPDDLLATETFCKELTASADRSLADPFTVVRREAGTLRAVPYQVAYRADMEAVSRELEAAAGVVTDPGEAALRAYLLADAKAFRDGDWLPADEAWARMSVRNSRWYLRIAPDEVYGEPCNTKALFHVSFGRIDRKSLRWQDTLDPLKNEMEAELARLAGPPYAARQVSFRLPDFMDVVLNAGDSRSPHGAVVGQSLPNFGPVANEGRGRTVAMTNLYTDPDSLAVGRAQAESLLCPASMVFYSDEREPGLMSTVLHEAAHNLGPAHQYRVDGKIDREAFGGPLASTLEELKAQTAALYFTDWLAGRKTITREEADRAHLGSLLWAFGHISRGMYDEAGQPRSYSQLAAIQLGHLLQEGAVAWRAGETAANGKDQGCLEVAFGALPASIQSLMAGVAGIKARGDRAGAEALIRDHVDVAGERKQLLEAITARILRYPKASFVYEVRLE
jgi:hypothetical protein